MLAVFPVALLIQAARIAIAPAETLAVEIRGRGEAIVFLPGLFGAGYGFRHVAPPLAALGRRTIVVEPLAMGSSSRPRRADYSLTGQADRVAAVLDSLDARDAIIVAHSVATGIALRLALRRPDLVRAIVSLDGGPAESPVTPGFRRAMSLAPLIRLLGPARMRDRIRASLIRASGDTAWVTEETIRRYTAGAAADFSGTLLAFMAMADAREPMTVGSRLDALSVPLLLLTGDGGHSERVSEAQQRIMQRAPNFEIQTVAGAGHYLHEERPDVVRAAIEGLLDSAPRRLASAPVR